MMCGEGDKNKSQGEEAEGVFFRQKKQHVKVHSKYFGMAAWHSKTLMDVAISIPEFESQFKFIHVARPVQLLKISVSSLLTRIKIPPS